MFDLRLCWHTGYTLYVKFIPYLDTVSQLVNACMGISVDYVLHNTLDPDRTGGCSLACRWAKRANLVRG
jgi:hypothetical protein